MRLATSVAPTVSAGGHARLACAAPPGSEDERRRGSRKRTRRKSRPSGSRDRSCGVHGSSVHRARLASGRIVRVRPPERQTAAPASARRPDSPGSMHRLLRREAATWPSTLDLDGPHGVATRTTFLICVANTIGNATREHGEPDPPLGAARGADEAGRPRRGRPPARAGTSCSCSSPRAPLRRARSAALGGSCSTTARGRRTRRASSRTRSPGDRRTHPVACDLHERNGDQPDAPTGGAVLRSSPSRGTTPSPRSAASATKLVVSGLPVMPPEPPLQRFAEERNPSKRAWLSRLNVKASGRHEPDDPRRRKASGSTRRPTPFETLCQPPATCPSASTRAATRERDIERTATRATNPRS